MYRTTLRRTRPKDPVKPVTPNQLLSFRAAQHPYGAPGSGRIPPRRVRDTARCDTRADRQLDCAQELHRSTCHSDQGAGLVYFHLKKQQKVHDGLVNKGQATSADIQQLLGVKNRRAHGLACSHRSRPCPPAKASRNARHYAPIPLDSERNSELATISERPRTGHMIAEPRAFPFCSFRFRYEDPNGAVVTSCVISAPQNPSHR